MSNQSSKILTLAMTAASRQLANNDRAWQAILAEKTRQVAELEQVMRSILTVCAEAERDLVYIDDIYRVMSGLRQGR
jgi:hypothetical protein